MLLLTTQALPQMREYAHPNLGRLVVPGQFARLAETLAEGWPVAADNGCFSGYDPATISAMFSAIAPWPSVWARIERAWPAFEPTATDIQGTPIAELEHARAQRLPRIPANLLWVAVPDVLRCCCGAAEFHRASERGPRCAPVGDADATLERFRQWHLWLCHLPLAFVLQDGSEKPGRVPWDAPGLAAVFVGGSDAFKLGPEAARLVAEARRRGLHAHMGRVNSKRRIQHAASIGCTSVDGTGWTLWRRANLPRGLAACQAVRPRPVHWQTQLDL